MPAGSCAQSALAQTRPHRRLAASVFGAYGRLGNGPRAATLDGAAVGLPAQALLRCGAGKGRMFAVAAATSNPRSRRFTSTQAGSTAYFSSSLMVMGMAATETQ